MLLTLDRITGTNDTESWSEDIRLVTNRHGRTIRKVYNQNYDFTTTNRFSRIDLGMSYEDHDFIGIAWGNDDPDNSGFGYTELPVYFLKQCYEVDSDGDDNPEDTPNDTDRYMAFRSRLRPNDDVRWGIARSDHGDGYQGIALYNEDTSDDAQPLEIYLILQR